MEGPELMQSIGVIIKQNSFETIHDKIPIALILDLITIFWYNGCVVEYFFPQLTCKRSECRVICRYVTSVINLNPGQFQSVALAEKWLVLCENLLP